MNNNREKKLADIIDAYAKFNRLNKVAFWVSLPLVFAWVLKQYIAIAILAYIAWHFIAKAW